MKKLGFVKMHGLGNDFIVIDGISSRLPRIDWNRRAIEMCERSTGIGADGLILALPSRRGDFRMRIFNSDGSEAEMCGNGLRCLVRLLWDRKIISKKHAEVETLGGLNSVQVVRSSKAGFSVRFSLGEPDFEAAGIPVKTKQRYFINSKLMIGRRNYVVTSLSIGNPHTVMFVDSVNFDWTEIGPQIENHPIFPHRTNVEFVKVETMGRVVLRSWERGAGPTLASGTGACASVAAGVMVGLLKRVVEVKCDLGSLFVEWSTDDNRLYQTGPAEYSYEGEV